MDEQKKQSFISVLQNIGIVGNFFSFSLTIPVQCCYHVETSLVCWQCRIQRQTGTMERCYLFIQTIHFETFKQTRIEGTCINKAFNSTTLRALLKLNYWKGVEAFALNIWWNIWFCFASVFLLFGHIVLVPTPAYRHLENSGYATGWLAVQINGLVST